MTSDSFSDNRNWNLHNELKKISLNSQCRQYGQFSIVSLLHKWTSPFSAYPQFMCQWDYMTRLINRYCSFYINNFNWKSWFWQGNYLRYNYTILTALLILRTCTWRVQRGRRLTYYHRDDIQLNFGSLINTACSPGRSGTTTYILGFKKKKPLLYRLPGSNLESPLICHKVWHNLIFHLWIY